MRTSFQVMQINNLTHRTETNLFCTKPDTVCVRGGMKNKIRKYECETLKYFVFTKSDSTSYISHFTKKMQCNSNHWSLCYYFLLYCRMFGCLIYLLSLLPPAFASFTNLSRMRTNWGNFFRWWCSGRVLVYVSNFLNNISCIPNRMKNKRKIFI